MKHIIQNTLRRFGYEIHRTRPPATTRHESAVQSCGVAPPLVQPVWPLPRGSGGMSDDEIRRAFAKYDFWHYAFEFEGGVSFESRHAKSIKWADEPHRPLQRFRHFMPYVIQAHDGSLRGKRVLDIACNSGFWSIQCGLLGAEVVGFDARQELIEEANLIRRSSALATLSSE
jgi:SAM-dependent methyltransferase